MDVPCVSSLRLSSLSIGLPDWFVSRVGTSPPEDYPIYVPGFVCPCPVNLPP